MKFARSGLLLAMCAAAALVGGRLSARQASTTAAIETRERAWRANNVGVAHLEQFDFPAAVASFKEALAADPALALARLNLGIALFYGGDAVAARRELESARGQLPGRPQADYVLGLIARTDDRTDDAIAAFERVLTIDPTDVGTAINLGQLCLQQRRYPEAIERFRAAIDAEPFNATAAYGLATSMARSGATDAAPAMARFQTLRTSDYAVTYSQAYLEQGRYAEAVASTGAEPGFVETRVPDVRFVDATSALPSGPGPGARADDSAGSVSLIDFDSDGDLDLVEAGGDGLRLIRNDAGRFVDATSTLPVGVARAPTRAALPADYDNDGRVDLIVLRESGLTLLRQTPAGPFEDVTRAAGLERDLPSARAAAWLDADHDGDLDLMVSGSAAGTRLFRNNGDGRFTDITAAAGVGVGAAIAAIVPTDFDNRRDVDLLLVAGTAAPMLYSNRRDGTFRDVAAQVGLPTDAGGAMAAAADVNKDGYIDFFFARPGAPGRFAISDGRGHFTSVDAQGEAADARAAHFLDYDGDGLADLFVVTGQGARLLRNMGSAWSDVSTTALPAALRAPVEGAVSLASGDMDGDGRPDLLLQRGNDVTLWRSVGAARANALRVGLRGRVTNRAGIGSKIEMRAGSLRQRIETYSAVPAPAPADVLFGLGDRAQADAVRVLWPSGILQAETTGQAPQSSLAGRVDLEELDRKPSSCPFLFTWNGHRFEFQTDFLGGGEMGYWLAPGVRNSPLPEEYVRIPGDQLVPRDGRLELRVTNELEEALFLDRLELVVVAHPQDVQIYPRGGLRDAPEPFVLYRTRTPRALLAATDDRGRDVLDRLSAADRQYVDDFPVDRIRGYAPTHALTLTLPASSTGRRLLLLTGWTDYAFSGDNVAAAQQGLATAPPSLEAPDGHGGWQTIVKDIGFPAGRPQTVTVDLTNKLPREAVAVRIVTSMRVYWDRITVGEREPAPDVALIRMDPATADLRWRGFSAEVSSDAKEPWTYDYGTVSGSSPWKLLPGRYTREGDVRPLLAQTDDMFVIARPGDEIALTFDASALPPIPAGWTRTYLLHGDGFSKEMDLHSSSPDVLEPLPFHGMSGYPYRPDEAYPSTQAHRDYQARYNTRIVARPLPPIELLQPQGPGK